MCFIPFYTIPNCLYYIYLGTCILWSHALTHDYDCLINHGKSDV